MAGSRTYEYRCPCGAIVRGFPTADHAEAAMYAHTCHAGYTGTTEGRQIVSATYTEADYLADRNHRERRRIKRAPRRTDLPRCSKCGRRIEQPQAGVVRDGDYVIEPGPWRHLLTVAGIEAERDHAAVIDTGARAV